MAKRAMPSVLTLNGGSSSIKFAICRVDDPLSKLLHGSVGRRDGDGAATLSWRTDDGRNQTIERGAFAIADLVDWLASQPAFATVAAIGHRIVHGGTRTAPARLTPPVLDELRNALAYAPHHLPRELELIDAVGRRHSGLPQVVCFDTDFHSRMPACASMLPLPRRYYAAGVRRYGFHGLSYASLLDQLARQAAPEEARGRVILAHLGSGASVAAVNHGVGIDTSMSFTPAAGLVMSTRSGDLDPGIVAFLAHTEQMTVDAFHHMVNHESGLLGISETSADMRDLLSRAVDDPRAADAVTVFCYQARKWIGAFAAALGGLDTLVFSAGIGERSAPVRARICDGLEFLGVVLDHTRNAADAPVISTSASRVTVRVIPTDEESMIARAVCEVLALGGYARKGAS